jgi:hypothetical protein
MEITSLIDDRHGIRITQVDGIETATFTRVNLVERPLTGGFEK